MDYPQNLSKSDQRWYDLIQECRTSGKSDRQWLLENNICSPTFYYHVKQLRKKACHIPENTSAGIAEKQEVSLHRYRSIAKAAAHFDFNVKCLRQKKTPVLFLILRSLVLSS